MNTLSNGFDEYFEGAKPGDWIALTRKVREHPIVGIKKPVTPADEAEGSCSRFEAWFDLLCLAQYKPSKINNKGQVVTLEVGQLMAAHPFLAARWNWSVKSVRYFMDVLEREGMISASTSQGADRGSHGASARNNQCRIVTISKYSYYQQIGEAIHRYVEGVQGQPRGSRGAAEGQPRGSNLTNKTITTLLSPPTPSLTQGGAKMDIEDAIANANAKIDGQTAQIAAMYELLTAGKKSTPVPTDRSGRAKKAADAKALREQQEADAVAAVQIYNAAAERHGYQQCEKIPATRMTRLIGRLEAIGGITPWTKAVAGIQRDEFLAGRVPGRNGQPPFRLTIDRLLQTDGSLGDVLVGLLEKSTVSENYEGLKSPDQKVLWGWWRGKEDRVKGRGIDAWRAALKAHKPNGQWPWWIFGPPPGHPDCLVPPELVAEFGFEAKYQGQIVAH